MAATGFLALPKEETATLIAATAAFQAATGAANATAARAFIFIYEDEPEEKDFYCIIDDHPDAGRFDRFGAGVGINNFKWTRGTVFALFQKVPRFGETSAVAYDNIISDILTEMLALQDTSTYRRIDAIAPMRTESPALLHKMERDVPGTGLIYEYGRFFTESFRP